MMRKRESPSSHFNQIENVYHNLTLPEDDETGSFGCARDDSASLKVHFVEGQEFEH